MPPPQDALQTGQGKGGIQILWKQRLDPEVLSCLVIGGPGLLDERGKEFEKIGALWGFVKALLQVHAVGSCYLPV